MKRITNLIVLTMLTSTVSVFAYSDTDTSQYKSEIDKLSEYSVLNGYSDGTFQPKQSVTRAEAAKMLSVITGYNSITQKADTAVPETGYVIYVTGKVGPLNNGFIIPEQTFTDFNNNHWAYPYVNYLNYMSGEDDRKVIDGFEDGSFRPEENVTITQLLKMAICSHGYNGYGKKVSSEKGYPDGYIEVGKQYGFLDGIDTSNINRDASREEAAKLIYNTIKVPMIQEFEHADVDENGLLYTHYVEVICNGKDNTYPFLSFETCLNSGNWTRFSTQAQQSPAETSDEFVAVCKIESCNDDEVIITPTMLQNFDGSTYKQDSMPQLKLKNDGKKLNTENRYVIIVKKENDNFIIERFAVM